LQTDDTEQRRTRGHPTYRHLLFAPHRRFSVRIDLLLGERAVGMEPFMQLSGSEPPRGVHFGIVREAR
jgi:hypothetical protein